MLWRLIDTGPLDGPANMAFDEALLSCFDRSTSSPILRLYGWSPPALSVGRYQDAEAALKLDLCAEEGVPVVRRMTGGGIIYHADELTYSIVCSPEQLGLSGVKEGFRRLCGFLLGTYRRLGLEANFAIDADRSGERLGERTAFCFAGKEEFDVLVNGRKIGGNAQRRLSGAILQHGSIPLLNRVGVGLRYLKEAAPGAEASASLAELGISRSVEDLKRTVLESFRDSLGVGIEADQPTPEELEKAAQLEAQKYRCPDWNQAARN